jgi:hypothetical protein
MEGMLTPRDYRSSWQDARWVIVTGLERMASLKNRPETGWSYDLIRARETLQNVVERLREKEVRMF